MVGYTDLKLIKTAIDSNRYTMQEIIDHTNVLSMKRSDIIVLKSFGFTPAQIMQRESEMTTAKQVRIAQLKARNATVVPGPTPVPLVAPTTNKASAPPGLTNIPGVASNPNFVTGNPAESYSFIAAGSVWLRKPDKDVDYLCEADVTDVDTPVRLIRGTSLLEVRPGLWLSVVPKMKAHHDVLRPAFVASNEQLPKQPDRKKQKVIHTSTTGATQGTTLRVQRGDYFNLIDGRRIGSADIVNDGRGLVRVFDELVNNVTHDSSPLAFMTYLKTETKHWRRDHIPEIIHEACYHYQSQRRVIIDETLVLDYSKKLLKKHVGTFISGPTKSVNDGWVQFKAH